MAKPSATEALSLNFVGGSSSHVNIHWYGISRGWCHVGKTWWVAACGWEISGDGSGGRVRGDCLRRGEVCRLKGGVGCLVLVETNGRFVPGFGSKSSGLPEAIVATASAIEGLSPLRNFTTMVFGLEYLESEMRSLM